LYEVVRATAFTRHTYRHTTMGFFEDIQAMPTEFEYSYEFYRRYYRPEYTTIVLAGDVTRDRALQLTRQYFGNWPRGKYVPTVPTEPLQTGPRVNHIDWASPTLPLVWVAFHGPAYADDQLDKAALDLLAPMAFGENSELYQKLVLEEQKVDELSPAFDDLVDPELFSVFARVKDAKHMNEVQDQILATFKKFATVAVSKERLDATRSRLRYGTALGLTSSEAIASYLAPYLALRRSPDTIDKLFVLYDRITPTDIQETAARYFRENHRTIVTLATKTADK
jgi:zinc protease